MSIILITGGQRSGKSSYAERLARRLSPNPIYLATAHVWDEEFRERVQRHQERRGPEWTTIEEERTLSRHDVAGRVVLVDCLTLWATNYFFAAGDEAPLDTILHELQAELDRFTAQQATFLFVTNEIGLGGTPANAVQRRFTDLLGWLNQYVAQKADEVVMMVSGIPVKVKEGAIAPIGTIDSIASIVSIDPIASIATIASIETIEPALRAKIDNLNKPKGSLGRLESLALQIGLIQQTLSPALRHPVHLLFGGDHGIEQEGVSVSPRCVTWQQMVNFTRGGGGVNMFCRQHGFDLRIIDVGVDHDLSDNPAIIHRKVRPGTSNFLHGPAMTEAEMKQCLAIGREQVDAAAALGCNVLSIGEMGIGNTSPSSIWMSLLLGLPLEQCVGAGAGLNSEGVQHKLEVLKRSVEEYYRTIDTIAPIAPIAPIDSIASIASINSIASIETILSYFGGFEMVAAVGAMLRAAELRMVVLVDGFIMTACALMATRLRKDFMDFAVFCHSGDESGHRLMLDRMGAEPLLSLGLRLGEGTGALCAYPIVDSAVRMLNEMGNFQDNQITKYFE